MSKFKVFLLSTLALMLIVAFSVIPGCTSPNVESATTSAEVTTENSESAQTTAPKTTVAESTETKLIRFVTPETDPATVKIFTSQIAEFEKMNPGVIIQIELVPLANLNSYYATNSAAAMPPEVGGASPGIVSQYLEQGALEPLDDVISDLGGENDFFTGALTKGKDGKIYTLPYGGGGPVLYYRSDLLEKYGVKPPENWDEWLAAAKALTVDENNDGAIDIYGFTLPAGLNDLTEIFVSILTWQQGKTMWDANMMPTFNTPEVINSFKFIKEISKYCPPGIMEYSYYDMMDTYASKRVAMTPYWGRLLSNLNTNAPDLLPVTKTVPIPLNADYNIKATYADYDQYIVFKDSKYPEIAKEFIKYITSGDRIADFMLSAPGHILPCNKANANLEKFWNNDFIKSQKENVAVLFDVPNYGLSLFNNEAGAKLVDNKWVPLPDMVNTNIAKTWPQFVVAQSLQKYLLGQLSAEDAVKWGQQEMERIIAESK